MGIQRSHFQHYINSFSAHTDFKIHKARDPLFEYADAYTLLSSLAFNYLWTWEKNCGFCIEFTKSLRKKKARKKRCGDWKQCFNFLITI